MDDGVQVRPAVAADGARLTAIDQVAWPPGTWVMPPAARPFFDDTHPPSDVLVAQVDRVVGYVVLRPPTPLPSNAHVLHVIGLAVDPAYRGRGIGHVLLAAAESEARRRGARKLGLRVLAPNTGARRLYAACGFVVEGRLVGEFRVPVDASGREEDVDDLLLAKHLR